MEDTATSEEAHVHEHQTATALADGAAGVVEGVGTALVSTALGVALWGDPGRTAWPRRFDLDVLLLDGSDGLAERLANAVTLHRGSLLAPLPDGPFDTIASIDGLNHVDDVTSAVRDLLARLRPGGRLVLATREGERRSSANARPAWHDWAVVGSGSRATVLHRDIDGQVEVRRDVRVLAVGPAWPERRTLTEEDLALTLSRGNVTVVHRASDHRGHVLVAVAGDRATAGATLERARLATSAFDIAVAAADAVGPLPVVHLTERAAVAVPAGEVRGSVGMQVLASSTAVIVADASLHSSLPQPFVSRSPMVVRYGRSVPRAPSPFCGPVHVVRGSATQGRQGDDPTLSVELPIAASEAGPAPDSFDVLAVLAAFNEVDIVELQLRHLLDQGIRCHVLDNWSTDGTYETVQRLMRDHPVTVERFPLQGPTGTFDLTRLLERLEEIVAASDAHWIIHHDVDEIRLPPWEATLREALWTVEQCGYNAVSHRVVQHHPTGEDGPADAPLLERLPWCEFERFEGNAHQVKAWRNTGVRPIIAGVAGHDIAFVNRRVFPLRFALHHFPIRSQEHGERKVMRERRARWNAEERARGWHTQYDHLPERPSFVRPTEGLLRWQPGFEARHLVEVAVGLQERAA